MMKTRAGLRWALAVAVCFTASDLESAAETKPSAIKSLPPHPRLLLDRADLQALTRRIGGQPWSSHWASYQAGVDQRLALPLQFPPRGGNWSHNYVCPQHGARLKQGQRLSAWQWEHHCPIGNHILRGDPGKAALDFDGNAIMAAHLNHAQLLTDAGVVYQVTGERRYAEKAREILLAYDFNSISPKLPHG